MVSVMSPFMSLCLFFLLSCVLAAPLDTRTVYAPPITNPTSSSVWTVGKKETVTWDATGIPPGVTGEIRLGYLEPGNPSEHLSVALASGFNLTDEKVEVTVPAVVTRTSYIVVLFGDSGNMSPEFTIQGSNPSSSAGAGSSNTRGSAGTSTPATNSGSATGKANTSSTSASVTPSPPIGTPSSFAPVSTPTSPPSGSGSPSSLLPTSSAPAPTPSNAARVMYKFTGYELFAVSAALLLIL
ncbi:hypothetical protein C8R43DRAFT_542564 [Mycena crocata]|nr:hypothetical protein C8R43DRAFT_542564 [Mycena crocata]